MKASTWFWVFWGFLLFLIPLMAWFDVRFFGVEEICIHNYYVYYLEQSVYEF